MTTTKASGIAIQKPSLPLGSRTVRPQRIDVDGPGSAAGCRNATNGLTVKPPWCTPLYSEDYGKHRPCLRLFGWRVLSIKYDR